jgi:ankyrin repeat protein
VKGWTPIQYAVQHPHVEVVRALLGADHPKADVKAYNDGGTQVIHVAPTLEMVQLLLDHDKSTASERTSEESGFWLPIHYAADIGNLEMVRAFMEADNGCANAPAGNGRLPVHLAAMKGHASVVAFLLEKLPRAQHSEKKADAMGWQAIHLAAFHGHADVVRALQKHQKPFNPPISIISLDRDPIALILFNQD